MKKVAFAALCAVTALAVLALSACGGGGRGGVKPTDPPPPPLVNGQCAATVNMCTVGTLNDIADTEDNSLWQCVGSGGGTTASCSVPIDTPPPPPPEEEVCANGAPDADDPLACVRGQHALPGIDQIPLNLVKLTNTEMQQHFFVLEVANQGHGASVRKAACDAYITGCADSEAFPGYVRDGDGTVTGRASGTTPFTSLQDEDLSRNPEDVERDMMATGLGSAKIASLSFGLIGAYFVKLGSDLPFLLVNSAGNDRTDEGQVPDQHPFAASVMAAIEADKLLVIAGHQKVNGEYIRHWESSGCTGVVNDGCIWAPYDYYYNEGTPDESIGSGTSWSAPVYASSLASILAVFPETTHQNLAKFGKACTKRSGEGIEALLSTAGGVGVADFSCMGEVTTALANLPSGGSATATVNGSPVTVRGRDISLSFAPSTRSSALRKDLGRWSVSLAPTGDTSAMLVGTRHEGSMFASVALGNREDFFGFSREHGGVRMSEIAIGHENAFVRLSDQYSSGGDVISSAQGRSLGFTLRRDVVVSENTVVRASAQTDRFLGGEANIPFGRVRLSRGEWDHQVSFSSVSAVDENSTISVTARAHLPETGKEDLSMGVYFRKAF